MQLLNASENISRTVERGIRSKILQINSERVSLQMKVELAENSPRFGEGASLDSKKICISDETAIVPIISAEPAIGIRAEVLEPEVPEVEQWADEVTEEVPIEEVIVPADISCEEVIPEDLSQTRPPTTPDVTEQDVVHWVECSHTESTESVDSEAQAAPTAQETSVHQIQEDPPSP